MGVSSSSSTTWRNKGLTLSQYLPDAILVELFRLCNAYELGRLCGVCFKYQQMISSNERLWVKLPLPARDLQKNVKLPTCLRVGWGATRPPPLLPLMPSLTKSTISTQRAMKSSSGPTTEGKHSGDSKAVADGSVSIGSSSRLVAGCWMKSRWQTTRTQLYGNTSVPTPSRHLCPYETFDFKISLWGSGGVGKSSLEIRMVQDDFLDEYDPTIDSGYRKQISVDGVACLLDIIDSSGQDEYLSLANELMRNSQMYMVVYDITVASTLNEARAYLDRALRVREWSRQEFVDEYHWLGTHDGITALQNASRNQKKVDVNSQQSFHNSPLMMPAILIGNKLDREDERRVSSIEGMMLAEEYGIPFIETSCKTGYGVEHAFFELIRWWTICNSRLPTRANPFPATSARKTKRCTIS